MSETTPIARLKNQILKRSEVVLSKHTRRPIKVSDLPDEYPKTDRMKYLESKYNIHIERLVFTMSLTDVCKVLNWEVDRSTVSRWRKHIKKHLGIIEYYKEEENEPRSKENS